MVEEGDVRDGDDATGGNERGGTRRGYGEAAEPAVPSNRRRPSVRRGGRRRGSAVNGVGVVYEALTTRKVHANTMLSIVPSYFSSCPFPQLLHSRGGGFGRLLTFLRLAAPRLVLLDRALRLLLAPRGVVLVLGLVARVPLRLLAAQREVLREDVLGGSVNKTRRQSNCLYEN